MVSKLENILQEEVLREINKILAEADQKVEAIRKEAEERAERIVAQAKRRAAAERQAELARAESAAELRVATARMQAKGEMIERVRVEVERALLDMPKKPEYPEVLRRLAEEALAALPGAKTVALSPDDLPHLEAWASEKGVTLKPEEAVRLGVRVYSEKGTSYVENTLPGRLERTWETLSSRVSEILWG